MTDDPTWPDLPPKPAHGRWANGAYARWEELGSTNPYPPVLPRNPDLPLDLVEMPAPSDDAFLDIHAGDTLLVARNGQVTMQTVYLDEYAGQIRYRRIADRIVGSDRIIGVVVRVQRRASSDGAEE